MKKVARLFHHYEDLALGPAYVLGFAFHRLGRLNSRSRVHGRLGALALLNELFANLTARKFQTGLHAAEPLRLHHRRMTDTPSASRVGAAVAEAIARTLPSVAAAVQADLGGRTVPSRIRRRAPLPSRETYQLLAAALRARCPPAQYFDLAEGCRALDSQLPTASVFHLHRVWDGMRDGAAKGSKVEGVPDPRTDSTIRCSEADATALLTAIQRQLLSFPR